MILICDLCGEQREMKQVYESGPCPFAFDCHGSMRQEANLQPAFTVRITILKDGEPIAHFEEFQNEYSTGRLDASCMDSDGVRHHVHARYNYGQA